MHPSAIRAQVNAWRCTGWCLSPAQDYGGTASRVVSPVPAGCGWALLSLPCVWAPGLTLGLVGHEAEEQGVHFSTVAVTFAASASSSTLPLQQLGVAVTEGTLLLLTQAPGQPWLLERQKRRVPGSNSQEDAASEALFLPLEEPVSFPYC